MGSFAGSPVNLIYMRGVTTCPECSVSRFLACVVCGGRGQLFDQGRLEPWCACDVDGNAIAAPTHAEWIRETFPMAEEDGRVVTELRLPQRTKPAKTSRNTATSHDQVTSLPRIGAVCSDAIRTALQTVLRTAHPALVGANIGPARHCLGANAIVAEYVGTLRSLCLDSKSSARLHHGQLGCAYVYYNKTAHIIQSRCCLSSTHGCAVWRIKLNDAMREIMVAALG